MGRSQTLVVPGYQVVQYTGSGARSTIWEIRDRATNDLYALKRVVKRHGSDGRFLEQAINEYEVGAELDHPVIRHIHRIRRIKRWMMLREVHLVMEFCQGGTVQDQRPTSVREAVRIFIHVAEGLTYMNAQGFVHADMKPNNILVAPDGQVKVIDLGQSCPIGTVKERIQGTPDFIAPEQVQRQPLDSRTDVYNFAAALYWTLTGRAIPTSLPKKGQVTLKHDMTFTPPEMLNPKVPAPLSKLITDCIELQPSRRPHSLKEVGARMGLIAHTLDRNSSDT